MYTWFRVVTILFQIISLSSCSITIRHLLSVVWWANVSVSTLHNLLWNFTCWYPVICIFVVYLDDEKVSWKHSLIIKNNNIIREEPLGSYFHNLECLRIESRNCLELGDSCIWLPFMVCFCDLLLGLNILSWNDLLYLLLHASVEEIILIMDKSGLVEVFGVLN